MMTEGFIPLCKYSVDALSLIIYHQCTHIDFQVYLLVIYWHDRLWGNWTIVVFNMYVHYGSQAYIESKWIYCTVHFSLIAWQAQENYQIHRIFFQWVTLIVNVFLLTATSGFTRKWIRNGGLFISVIATSPLYTLWLRWNRAGRIW